MNGHVTFDPYGSTSLHGFEARANFQHDPDDPEPRQEWSSRR